jgi:lysophospholipase L1-like esterase
MLPLIAVALSCACASPTAPTAAARHTSLDVGTYAHSASPFLRRMKFVAFGDSFTLGEVTSPIQKPGSFKLVVVPEASYPTKLLTLLRAAYPQEADGFEVINAGRSGEWAQDGAARLSKILDTTKIEVVLLLQGVNELAALEDRGINPGAAAIRTMVQEADVRGVEVVLATLPPSRPGGERSLSSGLLTKWNLALKELALAEGTLLVDLYGGMANEIDRYVGVDGLHPNEAGYTRIAELFFEAIRTKYEVE